MLKKTTLKKLLYLLLFSICFTVRGQDYFKTSQNLNRHKISLFSTIIISIFHKTVFIMRYKFLLPILLIFFISYFNSHSQTHFPGGVFGAEAWYIVNHEDMNQDIYLNSSQEHINIISCGEGFEEALFNFNPSIRTDKLCLMYRSALENSVSRNIFFVGEPDSVSKYSHVTTQWNQSFGAMDSLIRNRFDSSLEGTHVNKQVSAYQSIDNAQINFYHWNIYQIDKKFKSYGYEGETEFYIGKEFNNPLLNAEYFYGNFSEFISFPFELSANQKNRVESYLALKYGITLNNKSSYKNSKNIVFWNNKNNNIFPNFIFGIGRDDISGLNQLQSESVHDKDYLIASVEELMETNLEKQSATYIENNHFIVFGSNNKDNKNTLVNEEPNAFGIRTIVRKWLSQNTGSKSKDITVYFKITIAGGISEQLEQYPHLRLWMVHDKYVNNLEISNFDSQYVQYYEPFDMDNYTYGFFKDVYFDTDEGIYDQFTFGIGPEMIVQAQFNTTDCKAKDVIMDIVITGGVAPYKVVINRDGNYFDDFVTYDSINPYPVESSFIYEIQVWDDQSTEAQTEVEANFPQISVDLGPDITLSNSQQSVFLDAGQNVNDPEATYAWYLDGVLLEHYEPTLTVTQPGEYTVVVTAGNRICEMSDSIIVFYNFTGILDTDFDCENPHTAWVSVDLSGGVPPFTTAISSSEYTIIEVHSSEHFVFTEVPSGQYSVTCVDSNGNIFEDNITVVVGLEGIELDLLSQLPQDCSLLTEMAGSPLPYLAFICISPYVLDASLSVTNPNVTYEWLINDVPLFFTPILEFQYEQGNPQDGWLNYNSANHELTLIITNTETGCYIRETYIVLKDFSVREANSSSLRVISNTAEEENLLENSEVEIFTKLYPNPSDAGSTFYFEIFSSEVFKGRVGLYNTSGVLLEESILSENSNYVIPFSLSISGVYFIITNIEGRDSLTHKIIIR